MSAIEVVIEELMESPTVKIAITEAIPMIIPNMVSNALILFANKPERASKIFSKINIDDQPPFLP